MLMNLSEMKFNDLECLGVHSCASMKFSTTQNDFDDVYARGMYSLYNLSTIVKNTDWWGLTIYLYGFHAGLNANIFCGEDVVRCRINCYSNTACYGLTLYCHSSADCDIYCTGTCNFDYIYTYNGYPNIIRGDFSSWNSSNININDQDYSNALMTTYKGNNVSLYGSSNVLFCTDYYDCSTFDHDYNFTFSHIYCLGGYSCDGVNISNSGVVECSGGYTCQDAVLADVGTLICGGYLACDSMVAIGVENVYLLSYYGNIHTIRSGGTGLSSTYCAAGSSYTGIGNLICDKIGDICSLFCYSECCHYMSITCENGAVCLIFCDDSSSNYCPSGTITSTHASNGANIIYSIDYDHNPNNIPFIFNNVTTTSSPTLLPTFTPTTPTARRTTGGNYSWVTYTSSSVPSDGQNSNENCHTVDDTIVLVLIFIIIFLVFCIIGLGCFIVRCRNQTTHLKGLLSTKEQEMAMQLNKIQRQAASNNNNNNNNIDNINNNINNNNTNAVSSNDIMGSDTEYDDKKFGRALSPKSPQNNDYDKDHSFEIEYEMSKNSKNGVETPMQKAQDDGTIEGNNDNNETYI